MKNKTPDNRGFTLMEIIMSVVVIAILGVIAGRGFVEMAKGSVFSKKNATLAQQGQIAAARLKKEFSSIRSITCGGANIITYTIQRSTSEGPDVSSVYWAGGNNPILYLKTASDCTVCTGSCAGGDKLAENVSDFTLSYCMATAKCPATNSNCSPTFPNSPCFADATVSLVKFILKLKGYDDKIISIADPDVVVFGLESGN